MPQGRPRSAVHGGSGTLYNQGCRCEPCREAHRERMRDGNARRAAERIRGENGDWYAPRAAEHGTTSTYSNWGCRCDPCKDRQSERNLWYHQTHRKSGSKST